MSYGDFERDRIFAELLKHQCKSIDEILTEQGFEFWGIFYTQNPDALNEFIKLYESGNFSDYRIVPSDMAGKDLHNPEKRGLKHEAHSIYVKR